MSEHDHAHCLTLLGSLSEYVDGTLSETLCADIEKHIADCSDCHVVVDTLRKTISLYQTTAAQQDELPDPVKMRLFHRLNLDDYLQHH